MAQLSRRLFFSKFVGLRATRSFNSKAEEISYLQERLSRHDNPAIYEKVLRHESDAKLLARAAVLIPISFQREFNASSGQMEARSYFTLSKRAETMASFKGEVAFLGGKRDESDSGDVATAYREAYEEAGVRTKELSYLATLCPIIPIKPILISPVLAHFDKSDFVPRLNPSEVDAVFQVPTDRFLTEAGHSTKAYATESGDYLVHYFEDTVQGRTFTTWGYTAFMCIVVSALLHASQPAFTVAPGFHFEPENINATLEKFLHKKIEFARSLNK